MATRLLYDLMARVSDAGRALYGFAEEAPKTPEAVLLLADDLLEGRGEATGLALAREVLESYGALSGPDRRAFLLALTERFKVDPGRLGAAIAAWQADPTEAAARAVHAAAEPASQEFFRMLNRVPGGTAALVAMRGDLLAALDDAPHLRAIDADFRHLFGSWFNRGFLELRQPDRGSAVAIRSAPEAACAIGTIG